MKAFKLSAEIQYGITELDGQHQELIDLIGSLNRYVESPNLSEIEKIFDRLQELMIIHFSDEEMAMKRTEYPDVADHGVQHQNLLKEARNIFEIVKSRGKLSDYDINESLDKIVRHMLLSDGPFKAHLRRAQVREQNIV